MPLVLAVHAVPTPSANVPFAVILLQDAISNQRVPAGLKCRQLVPSSGSMSSSLWDVSDPEELKQWLDETINVDVNHEIFEVQEEFAIGLGEVMRARAAEKVMGGTKDVAEKTGRAIGAAATTVGQQAIEIDHKLRISERATAASTAIKESAVGRSTSAAFTKVGAALGVGTKKVLENEKVHAAMDEVHTATEAVSGSFKKLGASLSSLTGRRGSIGRGNGEGSGGEERTPQFVSQADEDSYAAPLPTSMPPTTTAPPPAPPAQQPAPPPAPPASAPTAAAAAAPAATSSPGAAAAQFALDDEESYKP